MSDIKNELLEILKDFKAHCEERTEELLDDPKDIRMGVSPSIENLIEYLDKGEVKKGV